MGLARSPFSADLKEAAKMTVLNDAEKEVHNQVQNTAGPSCTESHDTQDESVISTYNCESKQEVATACKMLTTGRYRTRTCDLLRVKQAL